MATKQLPLPGEIVKKSNALARARWSAESLWEPRLVALLASKVRVDDTDFHVYEIPVAEVMRGQGGKDYREIEAVIDQVMSRVLTIKDEKGRGWTKYNVFSRCRYRPKDGILELGFHPDLRPHYLNLQEEFAKWSLMEFLMLPSIYSQRIFEILKSWQNVKEGLVDVPLAELHEMLDTPSSLRQDFAQFRRRVLEKAHKDIHAATKLYFEWEPVKRGKAVVAVRFVFGIKKMALLQKEKAAESQRATSKRNDKTFKAAVACSEAKGRVCAVPDGKPKVCELCWKLELAKAPAL
jgi:plasmid replication initiation protein